MGKGVFDGKEVAAGGAKEKFVKKLESAQKKSRS
jgi:hypothetical protein